MARVSIAFLANNQARVRLGTTTPDKVRLAVDQLPYSGQAILTPEQAQELACALLQFADVPTTTYDALLDQAAEIQRELEAKIERMKPIVDAVTTWYEPPATGGSLIWWRKLRDDYLRAELDCAREKSRRTNKQ